MFGREKKEEDRITAVDFNQGKMYFMSVKTEQGGNTVVPITTNLSESELRTLMEGYIAQKGKLAIADPEFGEYIKENGFQFRIPNDRIIAGPMVQSFEYYIYKK